MSNHLVFFYDGLCPLCTKEVRSLNKRDKANAIQFVDIQGDEFTKYNKHLSKRQALKKLHGIYRGQLITGLDVSVIAWQLVGKANYVNWLRWPFFKPLTNLAYFCFAKIRPWFSRKQDRNCNTCRVNNEN